MTTPVTTPLIIDNPRTFNLPFDEFRPQQIAALNRIVNTEKRFVIIQAPTGSGKTLIAAMVQRLVDLKFGQNVPVIYTANTKQLQDQAVKDFGFLSDGKLFGATLKGKNAYPTLQFPDKWPDISPELCTADSKNKHCRWCCGDQEECEEQNDDDSEDCARSKLCPYVVARSLVKRAPFPILNIAMFLSLANFTNFFDVNGASASDDGTAPWLIIDEADELENALMGFIELRIGKTWATKLGIDEPKLKTVERSWIEWVREKALPAAQKRITELKDRARAWMTREEIRDLNWLERIIPKMQEFLEYVDPPKTEKNPEPQPDKWVWLPGEMVFKPVYVNKYAGEYLWDRVGRVVLMTATVISPEQMCYDLGIKREDVEFIDLPSDFDYRRRPVYYRPVVSVTHRDKSEALPKLIFGLDGVLDNHPNDRVLVHSVSYHMTQFIYDNSRHSARMLRFFNANERVRVIQEFREVAGSILVAPALERGVDLPDDLCRAIVVAKVPWPNKKDPQVGARLYGSKYYGEMWYVTQTIRSIVQMTGRGMRHKDDWCLSYVLDEQFAGLWKQYWRLFPSWWRQALILPRREA